MQEHAVHTVAAVRAILTSMTFVAQTYSFTVFLFLHLLIYHKAELFHASLFSLHIDLVAIKIKCMMSE